MAGRPRTPTNILKLRGVEKNHPERLKERENEPVNKNPIGNPPRHLTREEKKAFRVIVKESIDGVLGQADRMAVAIAARLLVKENDDEITGAQLSQLVRLLSQFGMTPADRSRINLPGGKPKNPFEDD